MTRVSIAIATWPVSDLVIVRAPRMRGEIGREAAGSKAPLSVAVIGDTP
jgi:hypothetical protein